MGRLLIILCFLLISVVDLAAQGFGEAKLINAGWKFKLEDVKDGQAINVNDKNWQEVNLPHDWSVKQPLSKDRASCTGYLPGGIGWYRKSLSIDNEKKGKKLYLYFEGVYNRSEVYVNGKLVGKRPNGYISFMYDVTDVLNYGDDNIIAVRVDHSQSADSRWYTGSGIYRDVWLVESNTLHIAQWGVFAYPTKATEKTGEQYEEY